jgi:hypothetical protein
MATALRPQNNFVVFPIAVKEAAYGTAVADGSITAMYPLAEPSLAEITKERVYDAEQIKGHEFAADNTQMTELWTDVTIPFAFPASTELAGFLYSAALGAHSVTGAGDPWTHTVTAQDGRTSDQLPSFSLVQGVRGQTASYKKYKGCVVNEVKFSCENRGRCMLNATIFSDGSAADASAFSVPGSMAATTPLFGKTAAFKIVDAGGGLVDNSSLLQSFDITWNGNLSREDAHSLIVAGTNLTVLRFGAREITATVKIWGSKGDAFFTTDFLTNVLKYVQLSVTNTANDSITFDFNRCIIESAKDTFDGIRNVIELTIKPFTITSGGISPVTITVITGVAAYLV